MRTTVELPDPLFRELKARAAFEGRSLKALMRELLELGLRQPVTLNARLSRTHSPLPSISTGAPFPLVTPSNADLFELLDADS
jgi:hypothetical protein